MLGYGTHQGMVVIMMKKNNKDSIQFWLGLIATITDANDLAKKQAENAKLIIPFLKSTELKMKKILESNNKIKKKHSGIHK